MHMGSHLGSSHRMQDGALCLAAGEAWADPLPSVLRGLRGLRAVGQGQAHRAHQAADGRVQERQLDAFAAAGDALCASGEGSSLDGGSLQSMQSAERRRRQREATLALLAKYNPFEQVCRLHGLCICPFRQVPTNSSMQVKDFHLSRWAAGTLVAGTLVANAAHLTN